MTKRHAVIQTPPHTDGDIWGKRNARSLQTHAMRCQCEGTQNPAMPVGIRKWDVKVPITSIPASSDNQTSFPESWPCISGTEPQEADQHHPSPPLTHMLMLKSFFSRSMASASCCCGPPSAPTSCGATGSGHTGLISFAYSSSAAYPGKGMDPLICIQQPGGQSRRSGRDHICIQRPSEGGGGARLPPPLRPRICPPWG